ENQVRARRGGAYFQQRGVRELAVIGIEVVGGLQLPAGDGGGALACLLSGAARPIQVRGTIIGARKRCRAALEIIGRFFHVSGAISQPAHLPGGTLGVPALRVPFVLLSNDRSDVLVGFLDDVIGDQVVQRVF